MATEWDGRHSPPGDDGSDRAAAGHEDANGPRCVLVVDDDASVRTALRRVVEASGYRCEEAATGHGALARVVSHAVDIVVTDCDMPGLNGLALLRTLEERRVAGGRAIAGILLCGPHVPPIEHEARAAGAVAVLRKPIEADELRSALAAAERAVSAGRSGAVPPVSGRTAGA